MTAELGATRDPAVLIAGDLAALSRATNAWGRRADTADAVSTNMRAQRTLPAWTGESADAYEARVTKVAAGWGALATAFRAAKTAVEDFASALDAARARAVDAIELWIDADRLDELARRVSPLGPAPFGGDQRRALAGTALRAEARAILAGAREALSVAAHRTAAALRSAIAEPDLAADEWVALLTGTATASHVMDALAGADGRSLAAFLQARPALGGILSQADPADVAPWWNDLDEVQQDAVVRAIPAVIGNLGGVAYAARDRANRIWLEDQLVSARAELREAEKLPGHDRIVDESTYADRSEKARTRLAALENIDASLRDADGLPRQLISLTDDLPPLGAISIGDLDSADNITFAVPGMGTTSEGMKEWARASQNIVDQQIRVDPARSHAVVAWVGYETPPVPVHGGGFEVMSNELAERGASNLVRDLRSVDAVRPEVQINVIAHSYGTTTASIALTREEAHVNAFVTVGSAGLPAHIDSASDLHADEVFAGQARDVWATDPSGGDQWAWVGRTSWNHPINPVSSGFGAHAFDVAGGGGLTPVTDHSVTTDDGTGYLDRRTESLKNVALATTLQGASMSPYVAPRPTPFQQQMDGITHGFSP